MVYPVEIKEHFPQRSGLNVMLVKKGKKTEPVVTPPHVCMGAQSWVTISMRDRGSDWGGGLTHEIQIGEFSFNAAKLNNIVQFGRPMQVGPYSIECFYIDSDGTRNDWLSTNRTTAVLQVLPNDNTDYIKVKLIPRSGANMDNNLNTVQGGGEITYTNSLEDGVGVEFCLKPEETPQIACFGASNKVNFYLVGGSEGGELIQPQLIGGDGDGISIMPMNSLDISNRYFPTMVYNVTVNKVDYGVVDWQDTRVRTFGGVTLEFKEFLMPWGDVEGSFGLVGGVIGESHRFRFVPVSEYQPYPELGFEIGFPDGGLGEVVMLSPMSEVGFLEGDGLVTPVTPVEPTTIYDPDTGIFEFCLNVVGRCFGASDSISFKNYDSSEQEESSYMRAPLVYNVTVDEVSYGVTVFDDGVSEGNGEETFTFGEWQVKYTLGRWGWVDLTILNGLKGTPVHFRLDPVDPDTANAHPDEGDFTVVFDSETGVFEFCLEGRTGIECQGATQITLANLGEGTIESYTDDELSYGLEVDGNMLVEAGDFPLLKDGFETPNLGFLSIWDMGVGSLEIGLTVNRDNPSPIHFRLFPRINQRRVITSVNTDTNPSAKIDEDGVVSFCLYGNVPM